MLSILVVLFASIYFFWQAYERNRQSQEMLKKVKEIDESLQRLQKDSLKKDSAGVGAFR